MCLIASACDSGGVELHCPGERPSIHECFVGRNFAECGGDGAPLYACGGESGGDCRWFVAGCVADGYTASACPADELCCKDGLPFSDGEIESGGIDAHQLVWSLYGNGTRPWNRVDSMVVAVTEDPGLSVAATDLVCEDGFDFGDDPCYQGVARASLGDMLFVTLGEPGTYGSYATIEIDVAAAGGPIARACLFPYTDLAGEQCPSWETVDCVVSGSVAVSSLTDASSLVGSVDLLFASGARIHGVFRAQ